MAISTYYRDVQLDFTPEIEVQSIPLIVPAVGPSKMGTIADLALYPIFLLIRIPSHMSECWHYIRFGTISDGIITGMHCIPYAV